MKEFDYEKAKAGAPVCTRDGRPARIVCWDALGEKLPILALIKEEDRNGEVVEISYWYDENGKSDEDYEYDLMMATVKHEGFINIFKDGDIIAASKKIYKDFQTAWNFAHKLHNYIATAKIEWEE